MSARSDQMALRKQALRMRASLERVELSGYRAEFQRATGMGGLLSGLSRGMMSARALPTALAAARRFPIIGTAAQMLARQVKGPLLRNSLRFVAVGWLAWQSFTLVRSVVRDAKRERRASQAEEISPPT